MSSETGGLSGNVIAGFDRALLPETLRFHALPSKYMDASWWQRGWLPVELFERLRRNRRSHLHLSRFLVRQFGLTEGSPPSWQPDQAGLAVTPAERLDRLVSLAGVTLLSTAIAGVLRSRDRNRIIAQIGEPDYRFAVRRGRLLLQQARLAQAGLDAAATVPDPADRESRRLGMAGLATALQDAPESLVRRVQLKLPKTEVEAHWQPLAPAAPAFLRLFRLIDGQDLTA